METGQWADEIFGKGLPESAHALITQAGELRSTNPQQALALLQRASEIAPEHPATLIAQYRFYFYGHHLLQARAVAERALALSATWLKLPADWRQTSATALVGTRDDAAVRFYLFALKGYAYLSLRLGEPELATPALNALAVLDPHDHVGSRLLGIVLERAGRDDDDEDLSEILDQGGDLRCGAVELSSTSSLRSCS